MSLDRELGDSVETALTAVGITKDRVADWLGVEDCGCDERKEKLNQLSRWAKRVVRGKVTKAKDYLDQMMTSEED